MRMMEARNERFCPDKPNQFRHVYMHPVYATNSSKDKAKGSSPWLYSQDAPRPGPSSVTDRTGHLGTHCYYQGHGYLTCAQPDSCQDPHSRYRKANPPIFGDYEFTNSPWEYGGQNVVLNKIPERPFNGLRYSPKRQHTASTLPCTGQSAQYSKAAKLERHQKPNTPRYLADNTSSLCQIPGTQSYVAPNKPSASRRKQSEGCQKYPPNANIQSSPNTSGQRQIQEKTQLLLGLPPTRYHTSEIPAKARPKPRPDSLRSAHHRAYSTYVDGLSTSDQKLAQCHPCPGYYYKPRQTDTNTCQANGHTHLDLYRTRARDQYVRHIPEGIRYKRKSDYYEQGLHRTRSTDNSNLQRRNDICHCLKNNLCDRCTRNVNEDSSVSILPRSSNSNFTKPAVPIAKEDTDNKRKRPRPESHSFSDQPEFKRPVFSYQPGTSLGDKCKKEFTNSDSSPVSSLSEVSIPELSPSSLQFGHLDDGSVTINILGEGKFGYVVRGRLAKGDKRLDVVAKYFKPNRATREEILKEGRILRYLESTDSVPRLHGIINSIKQSQYPILVQECVGEGRTLEHLMSQGAKQNTWFEIFLQAAKALDRIHRAGVLLNDIKFDNILVDKKEDSIHVKFVDMGLATFRCGYVCPFDEAQMKKCCHHIAPEVMKKTPSSIKSDLYSLGFVIKAIGKKEDDYVLQRLGGMLKVEDPARRVPLSDIIKRLEALVATP